MKALLDISLHQKLGEELSFAERDMLFEFSDRFNCRHRAKFERDLADKDHIFLARRRDTGHLVGFCTAVPIHVEHEGRAATLIYTRWAKVEPAFRKHGMVPRAGLAMLMQAKRKHPMRDVYWMMTASTLNSYLVMVRNFRTCWPRAGVDWPAREHALLVKGLEARGHPWDPTSPVVPGRGYSFYREGRVDLREPDLSDPDIAFYARTNPGQADGDSMPCLVPLTLRNWLQVFRHQRARNRR